MGLIKILFGIVAISFMMGIAHIEFSELIVRFPLKVLMWLIIFAFMDWRDWVRK